jgi:hypothetical protein
MTTAEIDALSTILPQWYLYSAFFISSFFLFHRFFYFPLLLYLFFFFHVYFLHEIYTEFYILFLFNLFQTCFLLPSILFYSTLYAGWSSVILVMDYSTSSWPQC